MSSSSGEIAERSSSREVEYGGVFATVASQEGCLPCKLYSPPIGENIKLKWLAKPTEEVKRAESMCKDAGIDKTDVIDTLKTASENILVSLSNFSVACSRLMKWRL